MTDYVRLLIPTILLLLSGCQSMEYLSIDYMQPAEISFPAELKRVAIVNNMPENPDNRLILENTDNSSQNGTNTNHNTRYYNGDAAIATESLAQAIADENYFDEVVICDSALRANDRIPRKATLSKNEVTQLTKQLDVDFLIALENVQMKAVKRVRFSPYYNLYIGTIDVKVYPTIRIYLPGRQGPLATLNCNDSIFWEEAGVSPGHINRLLIDDKELLKQTSEFAGSIPVKELLPYWQTARRYFFTGGSVNMRDAAIYAREQNWKAATRLWEKVYESKKGKQKMQAAYNMALGFEMQDSIAQAFEWAKKAQSIAFEVDNVKLKQTGNGVEAYSVPNYMMTTHYANELEKRKETMNRLQMQMQRFEE